MTTTMTNEINEIIGNIARKYSRNTSISFEDFCQELWVKALECAVDNIAFMTTVLKNKAIDISRADWKRQNRETLLNSSYSLEGASVNNQSDSQSGDYYLFEESSDYCNKVTNNDESLGVEICMVLDKLPKNAYKYAVAKAYLNGGLDFLYNRYMDIISELTENEKYIINSFNGRYTDDIILKVFCGIKSGTNSGSARTIKRTVKEIFGQ